MSMEVEATFALDFVPALGRKPSVEARGPAAFSGCGGPFATGGGDGESVLCCPLTVTGLVVSKEAEGTRRLVE